MACTTDDFLTKVLGGYRKLYDITEHDDGYLVADGHMHVSDAQYVVTKKVEVWSINSDEYIYFYKVPSLTGDIAAECIKQAYDTGMSHIDIKNTKNHMCTIIAAVFVCDEADEAAIKAVKKCRLYKSFCFSLKGWMEFHAVLVMPGKEYVASNNYGKPTAKSMEGALSPQIKKDKNKKWSIIKRMLQ